MQEFSSKKSIVKQNILQYIDLKGITKYDFYKKTGITRGVLDHQGGISEENIAKIIAYMPELNLVWLMTGEGDMFNLPNSTVKNVFLSDLSKGKSGVPYYDLPVSAGDFSIQLNDAKPIAYIDFPQLTGCTAILPVYGASMKGVVEPGDLIAIREIRTRDEFDPSMPHLVITDEYRMIKYLRADADDASVIWAESTNHPRIRLHAESIKMIYAIRGIVRIF